MSLMLYFMLTTSMIGLTENLLRAFVGFVTFADRRLLELLNRTEGMPNVRERERFSFWVCVLLKFVSSYLS